MHRGPARELKLCDPGGRPAVHAPIEAAELRWLEVAEMAEQLAG